MKPDVKKLQFYSGYDIDKIIGTYTGSFDLPAPTAGNSNTATVPITTNINSTTFYQGIFSLDSGNSWNPFYTDLTNVESTDPSVNPQGDCQVYGQSTAGVFNVIGVNTALFSATQFFDFTPLYKVALIAKPNQGIITPQPIGTNQWFNSELNYQKIFMDTTNQSSGTDVTTTVTHNLNYIPKVRAFYETGGVLSAIESTLTSTTASVTISGTVDATVYIRIYYD